MVRPRIGWKYDISWAGAGEREKLFIEEFTRVICKRDKTLRLSKPTALTL